MKIIFSQVFVVALLSVFQLALAQKTVNLTSEELNFTVTVQFQCNVTLNGNMYYFTEEDIYNKTNISYTNKYLTANIVNGSKHLAVVMKYENISKNPTISNTYTDFSADASQSNYVRFYAGETPKFEVLEGQENAYHFKLSLSVNETLDKNNTGHIEFDVKRLEISDLQIAENDSPAA